jgi:alanyl-tRNA synthetase
MQSATLRKRFVDYFTAQGHREVPSSSLVPADDPTLLFTNAGMVQFKRTFLGQEPRDYSRAVTVQKCVRAGGKHNDLEQVGLTKRHHTFFEMLGNFSFGDYFKKEAVEFAWEFVTSEEWLGIHPDRIIATVHHTDSEAREFWRATSGLPFERIHCLGNKDNFWQMGDTGPCGPCSEIFVDLDWRPGDKPAELPQAEFEELAEAGRFLEIWNLVFMQFDRQADGELVPLPKPSVDTGAGLERIAAVLQNTDDNFHTDLFQPLLDRVADLVGRPYPGGMADGGDSFRVLADHARAVSFLLSDGVYPSNEGRGYVVRRILRRAVRHAWLLGRKAPTLAPLTELVVADMGEVYPQLVEKADFIRDVTLNEEERFLDTIEGGLTRLENVFASGVDVIPGEEAFRLYDTFGFPIDLTQLIAAERGIGVDSTGFQAALEQQRERSRVAASGADSGSLGEAASILVKHASDWEVLKEGRQEFVGYNRTEADSDILAFRREGDQVDLVLETNPFYLESGGQVSDTGVVRGEGWELPIDRVVRDERGTVVGGSIDRFEPTTVDAEVDEPRRRNIERNHSATHLVHHALRQVLGDHVRQQGSLVDEERLRFDFSHHGPIDPPTLERIEREVNELVWANYPVTTEEMNYPDALALGAMAFFADKYGDKVRVVRMGPSIELCGGTHVRSTGQTGLFRFGSQGGVAAGVRRIEAVTGPGAYAAINQIDQQLTGLAESLKARPEHLARKVDQLVEERAKLESRIAEMLESGGGSPVADEEQLNIGGVTVTVGETGSEDRKEIGTMADRFRETHSNGVMVLFSSAGRGAIHTAVTDDLITNGKHAGELVKRIAEVSGGKGGGRPTFASAGAGEAGRLAEARAALPGIVERWLADGN